MKLSKSFVKDEKLKDALKDATIFGIAIDENLEKDELLAVIGHLILELQQGRHDLATMEWLQQIKKNL
jgi:hypothetical protein